eukprot:EG_transcript_31407
MGMGNGTHYLCQWGNPAYGALGLWSRGFAGEAGWQADTTESSATGRPSGGDTRAAETGSGEDGSGSVGGAGATIGEIPPGRSWLRSGVEKYIRGWAAAPTWTGSSM